MTELLILSSKEIQSLNLLPKFNLEKQISFFNIPNLLFNKIRKFGNDSNIFVFILNYGYFKSTNRFYSSLEYSEKDIEYISNRYNMQFNKEITISARTIQRYQKIIREYLGIVDYADNIKESLQKEAINLANNFVHRKKIFYALVELSRKLKIEIPSYTELARIITIAINSQKKEILDKLEPLLADEKLKVLDEFLAKDENYKNRFLLKKCG